MVVAGSDSSRRLGRIKKIPVCRTASLTEHACRIIKIFSPGYHGDSQGFADPLPWNLAYILKASRTQVHNITWILTKECRRKD